MQSDDYSGLIIVADIEEDSHLGWIAHFELTQSYIMLQEQNIKDFEINGER